MADLHDVAVQLPDELSHLPERSGNVGHLAVGRGTGALLAGQIRDSSQDAFPSLDTIADEWRRAGLGRLSWSAPGPGLMDLRIDSSALPAEAPEFVVGLLEGLFTSFASEPVGVAISDEPEAEGEPGTEVRFRFVVGAPGLIDRLGPVLVSGRSVPELMAEAWY
ncbi:MAG: hypothetical protein ACWGON_05850 [Gemmatimonadota bacterium]